MFIPSGFPTRLTTIPILVYYHFSRELLTHKVFPMRTRTSILRFSHFSTIFLFAHFFYTDCSLPPFCDFLGLHETGTIIRASCEVLGVLRSRSFSFFSRHLSFGFFLWGLWFFGSFSYVLVFQNFQTSQNLPSLNTFGHFLF